MFPKMKASGLPMPCLFYPVIRELGLDVQEVLKNEEKQAMVLEQTAKLYSVSAVVRMAELWCEGAASAWNAPFPIEIFRIWERLCARKPKKWPN